MSGAKKNRPELDKLLMQLRKGDKVVVYKIDRISRRTKQLIELAELFEEKGVDFVSLNDHIDTSTPHGKMFFTIIAAFAELERSMILERTKAGLEAARARGRVGGRPPKDSKLVEKAIKMYESKKFSLKEIQDITSVSKHTLYKYLKERDKE